MITVLNLDIKHMPVVVVVGFFSAVEQVGEGPKKGDRVAIQMARETQI